MAEIIARRLTLALAGWVGLCALAGCKSKTQTSAPVTIGSSTLPAPVASSLPAVDPKVVSAAVNPKGEAPYSGPTGSIRGVVHVSGDEAPVQSEIIGRIPGDCQGAKEFYGKLFREGPGRTLADVVIGVTGYEGYVPEDAPSVVADAAGCAWSSRTYVLTFGQSLDVRSRDSRPYVPDLLGEEMKAQLVALPRGDAIHLYPSRPARFELTDSMRLFMLAEVLVVKFPTHAVTKLDGSFVIPRVPVGNVQVSALSPATMAQRSQSVEVHAGESVELNFELPFELARWQAARQGGAAVHASATPAPSGAPAPSASH